MNTLLKSKGFTLVELMVVIIILGVLAAIAYPLYTNYIRDAHIEEGKAQLMNDAQYMQRWYLDQGTYADVGTSVVELPSSVIDPLNPYYTFAFVPGAARDGVEFTLQATPTSKHLTTDFLLVDQDSNLQTCVSVGNCTRL